MVEANFAYVLLEDDARCEIELQLPYLKGQRVDPICGRVDGVAVVIQSLLCIQGIADPVR